MEETRNDVINELEAMAKEINGIETASMPPVSEEKGDSGYGAILVGCAAGTAVVVGGYFIYKGVRAGVTWIGSKVKGMKKKEPGKVVDKDHEVVEPVDEDYVEVVEPDKKKRK